MTKGVPHPPDLRAEAVAAVLAGQALADVARRYGIPKGTLGTWLAEPEVRTIRTDTREVDRDEWVRGLLYDLVAQHALTLTAELQAAARPEWLEKQSAAELAQLVVAQKDTLVRLLAGLFPPIDEQQQRELARPQLDTPGPPADA